MNEKEIALEKFKLGFISILAPIVYFVGRRVGRRQAIKQLKKLSKS